jgi:hypothetical protein
MAILLLNGYFFLPHGDRRLAAIAISLGAPDGLVQESPPAARR